MRGSFPKALTFLISAFFLFIYDIRPLIPSSPFFIYLVITFFAVLLYVSSSEESWRKFLRPIPVTFLHDEPKMRVIRLALFILFPILMGIFAYQWSFPTLGAQAELRGIHRAPPTAIQLRGKTLTIQGLEHPLWEDAQNLPGVQLQRWEAHGGGDSSLHVLPSYLLTAMAPAQAEAERQNVEGGKNLYEANCAICHGFQGKGDGPAAPHFSPRPRDFTRGLYKIRSTGSGQLPTDEDLFKVITQGMPGTPMPGWGMLTEAERRHLVAYIKTFSPRFATEPPPEPIPEGKPIPPTQESIAKGKELYQLMECSVCHGDEGRGNGPSAPELKNEWGFPISPANLTKPMMFRGGSSAKDIRRTLMTGFAGTPMPSYADSFENPEEDSWHLANYVRSLAQERPD